MSPAGCPGELPAPCTPCGGHREWPAVKAMGSTALTPQGQEHRLACDKSHLPAWVFEKTVEITNLSLICLNLDKQGWSGH